MSNWDKKNNYTKIIYGLLFAFSIVILVLNSIGMNNWNNLSVPENRYCKNNFSFSYVDLVSKLNSLSGVKSNLKQLDSRTEDVPRDYKLYSNNLTVSNSVLIDGGNKDFKLIVKTSTQKVPMVLKTQVSVDGNTWEDIETSSVTSVIGDANKEFTIPSDNMKMIRIKIVSFGEGVVLEKIMLESVVESQKSEKDMIYKMLVGSLTSTSILIFLLIITGYFMFFRK